MYLNPDIEYDQNNGVLAVRPGRTGRFHHRVAYTRDHFERVWVFCDLDTYTDDGGYERFDHVRKGVMVGSLEAGRGFLQLCRGFGFTVENQGFFVPFSNGRRRFGTFRDGGPFADFTQEELRLARLDLLTDEELAVLSEPTR